MQNFPIPDVMDNLGGAVRFWYAPVADVSAIGNSVSQLISSLTFKATKDWYEGYALPGTLVAEEPPTETEHGNVYKCSLKGSYPKETAANTSLFEELKNSRHLVVYLDGNNQYKIMGTIEVGCRFRYSVSKVDGTNQYDFEFYVENAKPLSFIASDQVV